MKLILTIYCILFAHFVTAQTTTKAPKSLEKFSIARLYQDFDILKQGYIETHVGLWYNTYQQFDSLCNRQRALIKDGMTAWEFYKILAPVTAFTKEGHCYLALSEATNDYFKQYGTYFPLPVKIIGRKIYNANDGRIIIRINGIPADTILEKFLTIEPADGYNLTSKYHWIEESFSKYMLRFYGLAKTYKIGYADGNTPSILPALDFKAYTQSKASSPLNPSECSIDSLNSTALLTFNTFGSKRYHNGRKGFKSYLDSAFTVFNQQHMRHLIIDLRKNEGGSQGMEDIVLSYLNDSNYLKYKYVEVPAFEYSFINYTDYKGEQDTLREELAEEFYRASDGRYINNDSSYQGLPPNKIRFNGNVYILIGGLTFSGGSEFASLAKNHTKAVFIGEETGGGYYGNTSGSYLKFTLPNTGLTGRFPLCKFVLETTKNDIPFGRGLLPDYEVTTSMQQYLEKKDAEMDAVKKMIANFRENTSRP